MPEANRSTINKNSTTNSRFSFGYRAGATKRHTSKMINGMEITRAATRLSLNCIMRDSLTLVAITWMPLWVTGLRIKVVSGAHRK